MAHSGNCTRHHRRTQATSPSATRARSGRRLAALMAIAALFAAGARSASAADAVEARVQRAALATYIHGITPEIAAREVGADGVATLSALLADASFPRRDNVVAFLGHLGADDAEQAISAFLRNPPGPLAVAEEDRALLLGPQAIGQIAGRGSARALGALMAMTAHGAKGGILAAGAARAADPASLRDDLLEMALRGLAYSGAAAARSRLEDIAADRVVPAPGGRALRRAANSAVRLFDALHGGAPDAGTPAGEADAGVQSDAVASGAAAAALDTQTVAHDSGLDYANHVNVTSPMTDARLDQVLADGSLRVGRGDFDIDVSCCVTYSRTSAAKTFGSAGDGLDVIDDSTELNAVLNNSAARVKVVRAINYCGGPATNVIGCAWVGGYGVAVVRRSTLGSESVLWVHEYGHNVGLGHHTDSRYVMYGVDYGTNNGIAQYECDRYHSPSAGARADLAVVGACTDTDGDGVQDAIDNCPTVPNFDQADSNGDGIGDACDFVGCGNGIKESGEECDGSDLGGATCVSLGFTGGTLACDANCRFDLSACTWCGNGVREPGEACDGADIGTATCADVGCTAGAPQCGPTCALDYSSCGGCPVCDGDGLCEADEDCTGCPGDCVTGNGAVCGNGVCEAGNGENCLTCPSDCRGTQNGKPSGRFCCGDGGGANPVGCTDARCISSGFQCTTVPGAPSCCGDGSCSGIENGYNCEVDCGPPPFCGDGACNAAEDSCICPGDCGAPPGSEVPGISCTDGVDNDCGGGVDCADLDCAVDPACQCLPASASCTDNGDCCSGKCAGKRNARTCR